MPSQTVQGGSRGEGCQDRNGYDSRLPPPRWGFTRIEAGESNCTLLRPPRAE